VAVCVGGAAATAAVGFLPWLRSGRVSRDSFEVVRAADQLDLAEGLLRQVAIGVWYLLPALCALVLLTAVLRRQLVMSVLALAVGFVALTGGALAIASPLTTQIGAPAAVFAGLATLAGAVTTLSARSPA
jgi:hypothetical protein